MRALPLIAVLFAAGWAANTQASEFDMRALTCNDVDTARQAQTVATWLDGYLAAASGDTRTSDAWIEALYAYVEAECRRNPKATIFSIVGAKRR